MSQITRIISAAFLLSLLVSVVTGQKNLTARANPLQPQPAPVDGSGSDSDRARDGLLGPVRRVRTEVVKLSSAGGKTVEDSKHVLLETAEYDLKGVKTQNQYFPIEGATLTGREVYKYEFDSVGNWVKMTTSIAVVENAKISFEPSEVTYRTIFYYLDAAMAKMLQPASASAPAPALTNATIEANNQTNSNAAVKRGENGNKLAAALPPPTSFDKVNLSASAPSAGDLHSLSAESSKKVLVADSDPTPAPRPLMKPVSGGVLNGMAISLPAPSYPEIARRMHTVGLVQIEVVVDEYGKVISARAISGPTSLRDVAVQAAYRARFSPTKLSGQPVKIAGEINYNFTMP